MTCLRCGSPPGPLSKSYRYCSPECHRAVWLERRRDELSSPKISLTDEEEARAVRRCASAILEGQVLKSLRERFGGRVFRMAMATVQQARVSAT